MEEEKTDFKYSFLMSVYKAEKPKNLKEALDSMLAQTLPADEIVIIKDGPLTYMLDMIIDTYIERNPGVFVIHEKPKNEGLGLALRDGMLICRNEWVARMDSDDISVPERIEKQYEVIREHPELDMICSVHYEFRNNMKDITLHYAPEYHEDLLKFCHRRNPFGHDAMIFRKSKVLEVGNYRHNMRFEDYDLWIRMFQGGAKAYNIQTPLLYVRGDRDFYARRGGWEYFTQNRTFFLEHRKELHFFTVKDCVVSLVPRFIVCLIPNSIRIFIYRRMLRTSITDDK